MQQMSNNDREIVEERKARHSPVGDVRQTHGTGPGSRTARSGHLEIVGRRTKKASAR